MKKFFAILLSFILLSAIIGGACLADDGGEFTPLCELPYIETLQ